MLRVKDLFAQPGDSSREGRKKPSKITGERLLEVFVAVDALRKFSANVEETENVALFWHEAMDSKRVFSRLRDFDRTSCAVTKFEPKAYYGVREGATQPEVLFVQGRLFYHLFVDFSRWSEQDLGRKPAGEPTMWIQDRITTLQHLEYGNVVRGLVMMNFPRNALKYLDTLVVYIRMECENYEFKLNDLKFEYSVERPDNKALLKNVHLIQYFFNAVTFCVNRMEEEWLLNENAGFVTVKPKWYQKGGHISLKRTLCDQFKLFPVVQYLHNLALLKLASKQESSNVFFTSFDSMMSGIQDAFNLKKSEVEKLANDQSEMSSYLDVSSGHSKRLQEIWDSDVCLIAEGDQEQPISCSETVVNRLAALDHNFAIDGDGGNELAERTKYPLPSERACWSYLYAGAELCNGGKGCAQCTSQMPANRVLLDNVDYLLKTQKEKLRYENDRLGKLEAAKRKLSTDRTRQQERTGDVGAKLAPKPGARFRDKPGGFTKTKNQFSNNLKLNSLDISQMSSKDCKLWLLQQVDAAEEDERESSDSDSDTE